MFQGSAHSSAGSVLLLDEPAAQAVTGPECLQINERSSQTVWTGGVTSRGSRAEGRRPIAGPGLSWSSNMSQAAALWSPDTVVTHSDALGQRLRAKRNLSHCCFCRFKHVECYCSSLCLVRTSSPQPGDGVTSPARLHSLSQGFEIFSTSNQDSK